MSSTYRSGQTCFRAAGARWCIPLLHGEFRAPVCYNIRTNTKKSLAARWSARAGARSSFNRQGEKEITV
jgi:hypothetical protein